MILFQLAKWMEERAEMMEHMKDPTGDITFFKYKKQMIEETILSHTSDWMMVKSIQAPKTYYEQADQLTHEIS